VLELNETYGFKFSKRQTLHMTPAARPTDNNLTAISAPAYIRLVKIELMSAPGVLIGR
jgi:hypothetical protein